MMEEVQMKSQQGKVERVACSTRRHMLEFTIKSNGGCLSQVTMVPPPFPSVLSYDGLSCFTSIAYNGIKVRISIFFFLLSHYTLVLYVALIKKECIAFKD